MLIYSIELEISIPQTEWLQHRGKLTKHKGALQTTEEKLLEKPVLFCFKFMVREPTGHLPVFWDLP